MTAVTHPRPAARPGPAALRLVPSVPPSRPLLGRQAAARPTTGARPTAAHFRRRRAVVSLAAVVLLGAGVVLGVPGGVPLTHSGRAPAASGTAVGSVADVVAVARASYLVRPGDTLWEIARALQPEGDIRPLVQRLATARKATPLRAGERLVLPPG